MINSADRASGSINNCTFNTVTYKNVTKVQLHNFAILNVVKQTSANNGNFIITEAGPAVPFTIPPGTYDTLSLPTTLEALLNGGSLTGTYTVTVNPVNLELTISSTVPFSLSFPATGGANYTLGYGYPVPPATGSALSHTSPFAVQLTNLNKIGIQIRNSTIPTIGTSSAYCSFHFIVDNYPNYGSVLLYRPFFAAENLVVSNNRFLIGGQMNVQLVDLSTGLPLQTNGAEWQAVFAIVEEETLCANYF